MLGGLHDTPTTTSPNTRCASRYRYDPEDHSTSKVRRYSPNVSGSMRNGSYSPNGMNWKDTQRLLFRENPELPGGSNFSLVPLR